MKLSNIKLIQIRKSKVKFILDKKENQLKFNRHNRLDETKLNGQINRSQKKKKNKTTYIFYVKCSF